MNPYEANPDNIPSTDLYADIPFYGRYLPGPNDFQVDPQHIGSQSPDSLNYWSSVIDLCTEYVQIYPADEGGRDVFALGSVIVKSSHLHETKNGRIPEIDYSYADENEIRAIAICRNVLNPIRLPRIYFAGKINGRQVLVQERLPGVSLNVAFPYLSEGQRLAFKQQAREILRKLHTMKPNSEQQGRSHVVQDPNILDNGRIGALEKDILFSDTYTDPDMSLMHNDFTPSNCIVDNDKIVGLIDWEMAGFFGWKTAGEVHRRIRTPQREHFVNAALSEEKLRDIM
ncbi:kinase-like domain-containing protein [Nemania sp. FL0031]|nr:kinase-like domain-containing protein [Nemania sp. FL0031]